MKLKSIIYTFVILLWANLTPPPPPKKKKKKKKKKASGKLM